MKYNFLANLTVFSAFACFLQSGINKTDYLRYEEIKDSKDFELIHVFRDEDVDLLDPMRNIYSQLISDIYNPTNEDFRKLQLAFSSTTRPIVDWMADTAFIPKTFRFYSNSPTERSIRRWLVINSNRAERENCIISYASFNQRYPLGVKRLAQVIAKSDFIGHFHYQIGKWPNIQGGDLTLAHVPFAFKPCFFREMQRMGYKRVLWLDSSILPAPSVSLNAIFDIIRDKGFFVQNNSHSVGLYMNPTAAAAFGLKVEDTDKMLSCSAAIIGIDLSNPKGLALLEAWYKAAHSPYAFFSARSDQNALSILIHQLGMAEDMIPLSTLGEPGHTKEGDLFLMDRSFVKNL